MLARIMLWFQLFLFWNRFMIHSTSEWQVCSEKTFRYYTLVQTTWAHDNLYCSILYYRSWQIKKKDSWCPNIYSSAVIYFLPNAFCVLDLELSYVTSISERDAFILMISFVTEVSRILIRWLPAMMWAAFPTGTILRCFQSEWLLWKWWWQLCCYYQRHCDLGKWKIDFSTLILTKSLSL